MPVRLGVERVFSLRGMRSGRELPGMVGAVEAHAYLDAVAASPVNVVAVADAGLFDSDVQCERLFAFFEPDLQHFCAFAGHRESADR